MKASVGRWLRSGVLTVRPGRVTYVSKLSQQHRGVCVEALCFASSPIEQTIVGVCVPTSEGGSVDHVW